MTKKFIPETKPSNTNEWRLLLLDGHGSHVTIESMKLAMDNKIYVFYLPPHISHMTQLLDLTYFLLVKVRYQRELAKITN
jgi:hypothetical protein